MPKETKVKFPRISLWLSEPEAIRLASLTPEGATPQDVLRALIAIADVAETRRAAALGKRAEGTPLHPPGQRRGYSADDYQRALDEAGNISAAARLLGVSRKTVQEMIAIHDLTLPAR